MTQQNTPTPRESWLSEDNLNQLGKRFDMLSTAADKFGSFANSAMESAAQIFVTLPALELIVTIGAFVASGLASQLGIEVLAGLVFAQAAALYLVSHYRHIAMHPIGLAAIYLAIVTGAVNTGAAVYLALTVHGASAAVPTFATLLPAFSGGLSIMYYYAAKMFTAEQVATRRRLAVESAENLAEIKRASQAQRQRAAALDAMQLTRLEMERDALNDLANDPRMAEIQKRAMYLTVVNAILNQYAIQSNSKLGKQLLELADKAVNGGDIDLTDLQPITLPTGAAAGHGNGVNVGDFLAAPTNGYTNGVNH